MKIALCLSGHSRTYKRTFPYWKKYLLNSYKADVFIHMWDTVGPKEFPNHTNFDFAGTGIKESPRSDINDIVNTWNPVRLVFEPCTEIVKQKILDDVEPLLTAMKKLNFPNGDLFTPMPTRFMMYKRHACNKIKNDYEKLLGFEYDLVIQSRLDAAPIRPFPELIFRQPEGLYFNHGVMSGYGSFPTINDYTTAGSSRNIDTWCSFYDFFTDILKKEKISDASRLWRILNHHVLYVDFLGEVGCPFISDTKLGVVIMRDNGSVEGDKLDIDYVLSTPAPIEIPLTESSP